MLKVKMEYNPYLVKTNLIVDGQPLEDNHDLACLCKNRRLQDWIDQFFIDLTSIYREKEIQLDVNCTVMDSEDIYDAIYRFENSDQGSHFRIKSNITGHNESGSMKIERLKELLEKAQAGPFDEFKDEKLKKQFFDALSPDFEVNVIATMSSGKSTVVNAMLGEELMPAKNEACTATITRIIDCDNMDGYRARRVSEDGSVINDWQSVDQTILTGWNDDEATITIEVEGDIKSVKETKFAKLNLIDTPGPNNSRNADHRATTMDAINSKPLSMILYVLNATQFNIDDDARLLEMVANAMKTGGRDAQDRFIFVANKIDAFDPEKGESVSTALENVRKYLQENEIKNPLLIPTSAELTKLVRISRKHGSKSLSRTQRGNMRTFIDLFLEEEEMNMIHHVKNSINPQTYKILNDKVYSTKDDMDKAELLSGTPIIEALLSNFLEKHAIPAKIKDAVDSFSHVMHKAEGIKKRNEQLEKGEEALKLAVKNLEQFKSNKKRIEMAKEFREKIKELEYKPSEEIENAYKRIQKDMLFLLEDLSERFEDKMSYQRSKQNISKASIKAERLMVDTKSIIQEGLNKEFFSLIDYMRKEYQQHVKNLLDKEFPETDNLELKSFQVSALTLPDTSKLLNDNKYEEEVAVGSHQESDATWYKPWTWFKKITVTDYEIKEYIDMSGIWEKVNEALRKAVQETINNAKEQAEKSAEKAKQILFSAMDDIEHKYEENLADMKSAAENKSQAEKQINENKKILDWYKKFESELNLVLAI